MTNNVGKDMREVPKKEAEVAEFLGIRVLTPLEESQISGGVQDPKHDHDTDTSTDHDHVHG